MAHSVSPNIVHRERDPETRRWRVVRYAVTSRVLWDSYNLGQAVSRRRFVNGRLELYEQALPAVTPSDPSVVKRRPFGWL